MEPTKQEIRIQGLTGGSAVPEDRTLLPSSDPSSLCGFDPPAGPLLAEVWSLQPQNTVHGLEDDKVKVKGQMIHASLVSLL